MAFSTSAEEAIVITEKTVKVSAASERVV